MPLTRAQKHTHHQEYERLSFLYSYKLRESTLDDCYIPLVLKWIVIFKKIDIEDIVKIWCGLRVVKAFDALRNTVTGREILKHVLKDDEFDPRFMMPSRGIEETRNGIFLFADFWGETVDATELERLRGCFDLKVYKPYYGGTRIAISRRATFADLKKQLELHFNYPIEHQRLTWNGRDMTWESPDEYINLYFLMNPVIGLSLFLRGC